METALLGQFQPQTQQTGFASRKFSLLVKEYAVVLYEAMARTDYFLLLERGDAPTGPSAYGRQ
jgi:hypothetical protein